MGHLTDGIYGRSRCQRINFFEVGDAPQSGSFVLAGNLALSSSPGPQLTRDSGNDLAEGYIVLQLRQMRVVSMVGKKKTKWPFSTAA